jgi:hypothetical protein
MWYKPPTYGVLYIRKRGQKETRLAAGCWLEGHQDYQKEVQDGCGYHCAYQRFEIIIHFVLQ